MIECLEHSNRSGNGGNGEIVDAGKGRYVRNYKYNPGRSSPKKIWLKAGAPADGGDGGDVVLSCDPSLDSLLHLHSRDIYTAKKGPNGNPEDGSQGSKSLSISKRPKRSAPPCIIPVPPGTVIKRKRSGRFLGELLTAGDRLIVAKGGHGGYGVTRPSRKQKQRAARRSPSSASTIVEEDWNEGVQGMPGEQLALTLLLRIVADVGFVGLPNCGKSSLLAALSRANPEIAPYPFTTLVPNLGVMGRGGDPVLVDLPGLIEGAHVGRGLGRNFLRHLRRTRMLLQIVDGSLPDPAANYEIIRDELRMYNPEYCGRRHLVAISKSDLLTSEAMKADIVRSIVSAAKEYRDRWPLASLPDQVLMTSAVTGEGVNDLRQALHEAMHIEREKYAVDDEEIEQVDDQSVTFQSTLTWDA